MNKINGQADKQTIKVKMSETFKHAIWREENGMNAIQVWASHAQ